MRLLNFIIVFCSFGIAVSCSNSNGDGENEIRFTNGYFIVNSGDDHLGSTSSIYFRNFDIEDTSGKYNHTDLYSDINKELFRGFILDMAVDNDNAYILSKGIRNELIITELLTMKKKNVISFDFQNPYKLLVTNKKAFVVSEDYFIHVYDLNALEKIGLINLTSIAYKGISNLCYYNNKIYFSSGSPYGIVHEVDLSISKLTGSFKIGPYPNTIIAKNDGLYMTIERSSSEGTIVYDKSEFLHPTVEPGLVKLDPLNNELIQITIADNRFPSFLTNEGDLFCFLVYDAKFHSFEREVRTWNKSTNTLSESLNTFQFNHYDTYTSMSLRNSLLYMTSNNSLYVVDINKTGYQLATVTGVNTSKIVFTN